MDRDVDNKNCRFSLLIRRGHISGYSKEELEKASSEIHHLKSRPKTFPGTTYMQLADENGNASYYCYDAATLDLFKDNEAANSLIRLASNSLWFVFTAANVGVFIATRETLNPAVFMAGLLVSANISLGEMRKTKSPVEGFEDRIDYEIPREKYDRMKTWLDARSGKINGLFSMFFNNCTSFAVGTAQKFNLETPISSFLRTPRTLSNEIKRRAKNPAQYSARYLPLLDRLKYERAAAVTITDSTSLDSPAHS